MLKFINNKTEFIKGNYVSETKVFDDENNKSFFVVVQLGDLLYATYEKSYYLSYKSNKPLPPRIEGDKYLWFDLHEDRDETKFWFFYRDCLERAMELECQMSVKECDLPIPKDDHYTFEMVEARNKVVFSCGLMGGCYEIEYCLIGDDFHLFAYTDDLGVCCLCKSSIINNDINKDKPLKVVKYFKDLETAKKSYFGILFKGLEDYINHLNDKEKESMI